VNVLVVGVSHRSADLGLLEQLAILPADISGVLARLLAQPYLGEALVLSTCNRVEVYAAVSAFHGALNDAGAVLAERAGLPVGDLAPRLYAHYGAEAVRHSFRVAAGLDSMVVGESQILGQLREAYALATEYGATGRLLHELAQQALRTGKRVHAETGIDRAGRSVVGAALELGLREHNGERRRALVVGAGAMGALALATLRRAGISDLAITNRTAGRANHLAQLHGATSIALADLGPALSTVDIVVCATASSGTVITTLPRRSTPLLILDLAVPRDVHPAVGKIPGVTLIDIDRLGGAGAAAAADVAAAEELVAADVQAFLTWQRGADVAPTVAALRARADGVVAAELRRLATRNPDLTQAQRLEVAYAVHRVVQRLLHEPTVRARQRAAEPGGEAYAHVLRELFDLSVPPADVPLDVPGALRAPEAER
jgi:glutamyl-tRNA reductase